MPKTDWLERSIVTAPFYYRLILDEQTYFKELKKLKAPLPWPEWVTTGHDATAHHFGDICIVCVDKIETHTLIEVIGLLTHEAVHLWQWVCEEMGEKNPSIEFEAYSIQRLTQNLVEALFKSGKKFKKANT